ncbi:hypothetical protein PR048_025160 [Dryococelus australis]|uniref:Uncharacterized protein n=1 Tax=Dryococelus australis TaxID=614101 RepID=A0ABQ9GQN5_9NEOP|nr:hypothetical protein PR048_025160 [Dryococelus australis]
MAPGIVILEVTRVHSVKTLQCWEHFIIQKVTIGLCVHATTDKHQRSYAEGRETQNKARRLRSFNHRPHESILSLTSVRLCKRVDQRPMPPFFRAGSPPPPPGQKKPLRENEASPCSSFLSLQLLDPADRKGVDRPISKPNRHDRPRFRLSLRELPLSDAAMHMERLGVSVLLTSNEVTQRATRRQKTRTVDSSDFIDQLPLKPTSRQRRRNLLVGAGFLLSQPVSHQASSIPALRREQSQTRNRLPICQPYPYQVLKLVLALRRTSPTPRGQGGCITPSRLSLATVVATLRFAGNARLMLKDVQGPKLPTPEARRCLYRLADPIQKVPRNPSRAEGGERDDQNTRATITQVIQHSKDRWRHESQWAYRGSGTRHIPEKMVRYCLEQSLLAQRLRFMAVDGHSEFLVNIKCGRGCVVIRLLASHLGEPGSVLSGVALGFSHVVIMPDNVARRRVFSGISRFPHPGTPAFHGVHWHYLLHKVRFWKTQETSSHRFFSLALWQRGNDSVCSRVPRLGGRVPFLVDIHSIPQKLRAWADYSSLAKANQVRVPAVSPVSSHVRIVSDDAAGRRVFSGFSSSPRLCIPALHLASPTSALATSMRVGAFSDLPLGALYALDVCKHLELGKHVSSIYRKGVYGQFRDVRFSARSLETRSSPPPPITLSSRHHLYRWLHIHPTLLTFVMKNKFRGEKNLVGAEEEGAVARILRTRPLLGFRMARGSLGMLLVRVNLFIHSSNLVLGRTNSGVVACVGYIDFPFTSLRDQ